MVKSSWIAAGFEEEGAASAALRSLLAWDFFADVSGMLENSAVVLFEKCQIRLLAARLWS